jgi:hypothetical protein
MTLNIDLEHYICDVYVLLLGPYGEPWLGQLNPWCVDGACYRSTRKSGLGVTKHMCTHPTCQLHNVTWKAAGAA